MAQISFYSPTHAELVSYLDLNSSKKIQIVDYGCGEGELLNYLPMVSILKYDGYEVNKLCIPVAEQKWKSNKNIQFHQINRKKLPELGKANSVDVIILVGVVQYLPKEDWAHVLKEAKKVLRKNGKLLISCTNDHAIYKWLNLYRFFLPIHTVNRSEVLRQIKKNNFKTEKVYERGVLLTPLFSNIFVFFFDAVDKMLFRTKGELGPVGRGVRALFAPIIKAEFNLNFDFGYTLFIVASK